MAKSAHMRARDKATELDELHRMYRHRPWSRTAEVDAHARRLLAELMALLLEADRDVADAYDTRRGPRACSYCRGPIPPTARSDATTCSKRCRQAKHRGGSGRKVRPWPAVMYRRPAGPATDETPKLELADWRSAEARALREQLGMARLFEEPELDGAAATAQPSTAELAPSSRPGFAWASSPASSAATNPGHRIDDASRGRVVRSSAKQSDPTTPKPTPARKQHRS